MARYISSFILVTFLLQFIDIAASHRVLFIPFGNKSHLIEFHGLGEVLLKRGHEVYIYMSPVDTAPAEIVAAGYKFIYPNFNESIMFKWFSDEEMIKKVNQPIIQQLFEERHRLKVAREQTVEMGLTLLNDVPTFDLMKSLKFDVAVVDYISFMSFLFVIPHKLGIPYVSLSTYHTPFALRIPHLPSAFTDVMAAGSFGVKADQLGSSMYNRFANFVATLFNENFMTNWTPEVYENVGVTKKEVFDKILVHLVDQTYLLSDAMPTMPNVLMVGGLVTRPAKPLRDEKLISFLSKSPEPLVVCSFGTMLETLTPEIYDKIIGAFGALTQYKFVMRIKTYKVQNPPKNMLILNWLPQNDILAHNSTALFITHSGNNGQQEALYHGVPMVAFYIFGDQLYNAERVERRGYGVKLNLLDFTQKDLENAIVEVMTNKKYSQKIKTASEIFRQKHAGDVASDAIEHVIQFGGDHLRSEEALSMSVYEFTMIDIVLFIFSCILILFALFTKLLKKVAKAIFGC